MAEVVTISGDREVVDALRGKAAAALKLKGVMGDAADFSERQIRGIPTDTGRLAASTRGGPDQLRRIRDDGFDLGTSVYYGRFVFEGTKRMRARAPQINTGAIARDSADRINQHLEKAA